MKLITLKILFINIYYMHMRNIMMIIVLYNHGNAIQMKAGANCTMMIPPRIIKCNANILSLIY